MRRSFATGPIRAFAKTASQESRPVKGPKSLSHLALARPTRLLPAARSGEMLAVSPAFAEPWSASDVRFRSGGIGVVSSYRVRGWIVCPAIRRESPRDLGKGMLMGSSAATSPEGPGSVSGAPNLPEGFTEALVIPGCGHWTAEQAPEDLLAALTAFLAPLPGRDGLGIRGARGAGLV